MKLTEVQQQAVQARMNLIVGAHEYDRLFLGVIFSEVVDGVLYAFAQSETLAAEIEEKYALHPVYHRRPNHRHADRICTVSICRAA